MEVSATAGMASAQGHLLPQFEITPLLPIVIVIKDVPRKVYLKLEGTNPTGSVKYRTAYSLIASLEAQGMLRRGSTIVESTSGNLGVALAFLCREKGYHFIAVVDPKTTQENLEKMQSMGARIAMVDQPDENGGFLLSRLRYVQQLRQSSREYVWPNQYMNEANPSIHYRSTGPEIYRQMSERVDAAFVAVSTGGTLGGIGRFFREVSPQTQVIGVDAHGSVIFGTPPGPRKLTGIGSSRLSSFLTPDLYHTYMLVGDREAFAFCRALYAQTKVSVGGSSGAVLAACARYLHEHPDVCRVVCLCADTGENYSSSIFSDEWMAQQGMAPTASMPDGIDTILPGSLDETTRR